MVTLHSQCEENSSNWEESWTSCSTSANPNSLRGNSHWILYEFDAPHYITTSHIWNANRTGESGRGLKDVIIDYSIDGSSWIHLGDFTFSQGTESINYQGIEGPDFGSLYIKKILITVLNTHDGGACASLAEILFTIDTTKCHGIVDDCGECNGPGAATWYIDADGDGYGDLNIPIVSCTQPAGFVSNGLDCNDQDAMINIDALELCDNGIDDDCDGLIDAADPDVTGSVFWYEDLDADGYGNPQVFSLSCSPPDGYVMNNTDCDDNNNLINPAALELCDNGIDDDCDGLIDSADPDVATVSTWYLDSDGDGFGDPDNSIQTCNPSANYVFNSTDCDDTNPLINPNGVEVCNSLDDDCNGLIDINDPGLSGAGIWFADLDGDGYGDPNNSIFECSQLPGYLPNNQDCDDNDPNINPDAIEICNGVDDNCDGQIDDMDPSVILTVWYLDVDGDGYGDPENSQAECFQPFGFVDNDLDCDDLNPDVNPAATEIPNNDIDENCDGDLTSVISFTDSGYRLYPNPVITMMNVDGNRGDRVELSLINIQGKIILENTYTLPTQINVDHLQSGTYLILVKDPVTGTEAIEKMIKLN